MTQTSLIQQASPNPTRKVGAAAAAGAALTIALWVAETFFEVRMDAGTQGAFHTLVAFTVSWFVKDRMNV